MPGKTRPSLRAKTLQNVALSNLSLTDKKCIEEVFKKFEELSQADVVEVVHGEWLRQNGGFFFLCSVCGKAAATKGNYCHSCGAKMDGGS